MKLEPRRVELFLRDPGSTRLVLLHGDDHGLIRERATQLVRAVAGSTDDPFDVVELDRDAIVNFPTEMSSQSLTGRRRVIRVRDAGDTATEAVKRGLAGSGSAFAVLEAGSLTARSKLRQLIEQAPDAQAIPCYPVEGAAATGIVTQVLRDASVGADSDAVRWLVETVTGDQALLRREAEKLALLIGPGGKADLDTTMLAAGDHGGLSVDDALFAATSGDVARADRALETALAEGTTAVGLLRAAVMHVHRLLRTRLVVDGGVAPSDAVSRTRPAIYYRRVGAFSAAVTSGTAADFEAMAGYLSDTERACKRTGAPAEMLAKAAILTIARRMSQRRQG